MEQIRLPPILPPSHLQTVSRLTYALPPISALEDLRGIHSHDSAAVLRRLKANDDYIPGTGRLAGEQPWTRGRPLSAPPHKHPSEDAPMSLRSPKHQPAPSSVSNSQARLDHRFEGSSFDGPSDRHRSAFTFEPSGDESSTCDPSPVSPVTPRSVSGNDNHFGLASTSALKDQSRIPQGYAFISQDWPQVRGANHIHSHHVLHDRGDPMYQNSYREDSDNDSIHPVRPW